MNCITNSTIFMLACMLCRAAAFVPPIGTVNKATLTPSSSSLSFVTPTHTYDCIDSTVLQKQVRFEQRSMIATTGSSIIINGHLNQRQRGTSISNRSRVRMQFLFGLGGPELVVILIAAAFLLGPEKLAELGKDAGKIAGELKEVPKEFQAGLAEGEAQARAMKAQNTETPPSTTTTTVQVTKTEESDK